MLLREFIYFNETDPHQHTDKRYDPDDDNSILNINDTRKTRLTLKMLNQLRLAGESREQETLEDLELVRHMYANPPAEVAPV